MKKEEIFFKALRKLRKEKQEKEHLRICIKADICPECGSNAPWTKKKVERKFYFLLLPSVLHVGHKCTKCEWNTMHRFVSSYCIH